MRTARVICFAPSSDWFFWRAHYWRVGIKKEGSKRSEISVLGKPGLSTARSTIAIPQLGYASTALVLFPVGSKRSMNISINLNAQHPVKHGMLPRTVVCYIPVVDPEAENGNARKEAKELRKVHRLVDAELFNIEQTPRWASC